MDLPRFVSGIGSRRRCTFWLLALSAATASALTGGCQRNAGPAVAGAVWQTEPADLDPNGDADGDALDDTLEDRLAERFAPIVFHGDRETAFPVSVETWLRHSSLGLAVNGRWVRRVVGGPLTQPQLVNQRTSVGEVALASTGARSRGKRESFVLEPIEAVNRPGPLDSTDWVTYVHSYRNGHDGVTLQYWRAYVRNDASVLGVDLGHGGDWEAIAVHLDARYQPVRTTYLDHSGIVDVTTSMKWEGSHPLVWSEEGGHSSSPDASRSRSTRWYRQETWTGGVVTRWDAVRLGASGGLRNVGEKSHPRNRQLFIRYSGLWGPPGRLFSSPPDTGDRHSTKPAPHARMVRPPTGRTCGGGPIASAAARSGSTRGATAPTRPTSIFAPSVSLSPTFPDSFPDIRVSRRGCDVCCGRSPRTPGARHSDWRSP